ncbi:uncharacterized protein EMH_0066820 [Eimeria mitis]|uniref:Uncharacterized protein n=1 Tax=Eimeria mitis TaxID=44415 RepID=U6K139_9EIME|nr:uncharacterized protein EMH_0066820 [Eimeria mitis]CDJ31440.1 hypothetical protein, conserved [Eimeria mitis]
MPEVASTSRGHRGEHSLQTIRTPGDLFGASSSEQQHQAVGSTQRRRRIFPQGDSDGWEPSPKKSGWLAHGSSVVAGAEGPRSAVHQLPEAVQQTPGSLYAHSPYLWHPSVPATFAPQPGLATPALVLQGAQQAQHIGQLMGQRVTLQPPTIPPVASSALPTGSSIVSVLSIEDSTQASASQRVSVPATQSGSLALAYAAQSGSLASTSASQSDSLASAGPLSQRDNEASTRRSALMEVVAPGPSAESKSRHPFVRMPTLMPWVRVADVQEEIPDSWTATEAMVYLLRTVRNLCLKPALDLRDTNELVGAAINLARRALISMTTPLVDVKASTAADTLGRRFLVFKAFHTVLKLVGDEKPRLRELWHTLVASIPTAYSNRFTGAYSNKHMFQVELSYQLSAALELYKSGSSPSDDEIIALHRKLFCMKFSPRAFLRDAWDPWRQDDTEYRDGP